MNKIISNDASQVLRMADEKHWAFHYIGAMAMLTAPEKVGSWEFEPCQDKFTITKRVRQRFDEIEKLGVGIKGIVIGHDTHQKPLLTAPRPKLLAEPNPEPEIEPIDDHLIINKPDQEVGVRWSNMFKILGTIAVITMAIPAVIMGGFLLLIPYVLMNDPAYIVVLEDGSWIEVAREFE